MHLSPQVGRLAPRIEKKMPDRQNLYDRKSCPSFQSVRFGRGS
jgi:hypothetical protein